MYVFLRQIPRSLIHLAGPFRQKTLHNPVFQAVKRHQHQPSTGTKNFFRRTKRALQFAQFVVDENAQRLEYARRGMDLALGIAPDMRFDGVGKVQRAASP